MGNAPAKGPQQKNKAQKKYVHWDQAVPPWPPGKPHLVPGSPNTQPNVVTIRWDPPPDDGGAPITGYVVEHRKAGTPNWIRATTDLVLQPELELSGLEPGWRYQFRVTAENAADLLSDPGELSQPLTVARAYRPATMAPQFSLELRDTVTLENEKAQFIVHFHGIPTPKIAWYKDSFEIFSSRRMRVIVENDMSSLIIHQTAFSDEGEYKCAATNRAGHIITKAKLRLEAPPRIRIPRQYEDGLIFEKDEVIRLKVSVAGRPLPRATWYHNGEPIPFGGRYEVSNTDRSSGLRISEARRADRGEYQVRASSRLGEHVVSFLVTVTDRPLPPGRAVVVSVAGRSVTLSWSEPDDDGGCKIGNYIVEYYRLGWNVWLKAATCRHLTTTLADLIEGSEYKFRVKAENPYGVSDPSLESEAVFVPDPKRGLLEPPARGIGNRTDIPLPDQPDNKQREHKRSKDSLVGKDKETQEINKSKENEEKIVVSDKEAVDRKKLKSELTERIEERRSVNQHEIPDVTRRKNRESEIPEAVRRQRETSRDELELENIWTPPPRSWEAPTESEKGLKASLQFSVARRRESSGEHDSGVSEGSFNDGKQNFTSPLLPREDDSLLHGSSELMLVLLPETRDMRSEKDAERNTNFAIFGDSSIPPPLSLSAPEIGGGEPWVTSPLRNAVSSTELLHEQAMARFYQAVAAEEAEKARQRKEVTNEKSAEPSISWKVAVEFSRKVQEHPPIQELTWHQRKQRTVQDRRASLEAASHTTRSLPQPEFDMKSTLSRKEPAKITTEEEEDTVFEAIRIKTATEVAESKYHSTLGHREEERIKTKAREKGEEIQERDWKVKFQEEDEGDVEEEELGEELYEDEELEEEESLEEESSEFDEEEELYKSMEEEEEIYHPSSLGTRHIERFAEQEDDTYHPRDMVPYASSVEVPLARASEWQHTAWSTDDATTALKSILKHNSKFQEDLEDTRHELSIRELERSPPKSFRESLPKDLVPSSISERHSHWPSSPFEPRSPELPQPVEQQVYNAEEFRVQDDIRSIPSKSAPFLQQIASSTIESRISPTRPNTHIAAPIIFATERTIHTGTPAALSAEASKNKLMLISKSSNEEDTEASRAVADYYGDIIRDHARPKKTIRQYLNTAEMKAAASMSQNQGENLPTPTPQVSRTPEAEPELEFSLEEQVVTAEQSSYNKFTAQVTAEKGAPDRHTAPVTAEKSARNRYTAPVTAKQSTHDRYTAPVTSEQSSYNKFTAPVTAEQSTHDKYTAPVIAEQSTHDRYTAPVTAEKSTHDRYTAPVTAEKHARDRYTAPVTAEKNTYDTYTAPTTTKKSASDRYTGPVTAEQNLYGGYASPITAEQREYDRCITPVQQPPTRCRKSRTPDLVRSRQSSKDRSRVPSTERFPAELPRRFPGFEHRFFPERHGPEEPENSRAVFPKQDEQLQVAKRKWRSVVGYLADFAMFLVACWLYAFKDERLAIPVLVLMVYRQLQKAIQRRLPKLPSLPWKRSS